MKRLFKFKYPKLTLLILFSLLSYFIFSNPNMTEFVNSLEGFVYWASVFIAGFLFSFGFTTPPATAFFIVLEPKNILMISLLGGIGSALSDILIFKTIKYSFMGEFKRLEKTKLIRTIEREFTHLHYIKIYLLYIIAGIAIVSPLPDELGVSMLAGMTKIKSYILGLISFILKAGTIWLLISI